VALALERDHRRHSFASLSLADGAKIEDVSRQLGHEDITTTRKHYARFLPKSDERFLNTLDSAFDEEQREAGRVRNVSAADADHSFANENRKRSGLPLG
jgi:hypothetical protein